MTRIIQFPLSRPTLSVQIAAIVAAVNTAKDGGDYYAANMIFVAGLHLITRGKRVMEKAMAHWCYIEVAGLDWGDAFDVDDDDPYYDLLNISAGDLHTCIPVPMLQADIIVAAYSACSRIERGEHNRETDPTAPDRWSAESYHWLRMGEEAAPLYLSAHGLAEVNALRGQRIHRTMEVIV